MLLIVRPRPGSLPLAIFSPVGRGSPEQVCPLRQGCEEEWEIVKVVVGGESGMVTMKLSHIVMMLMNFVLV